MGRLANPARVTLAQKGYVAFDPDQRYSPVHAVVSGIMMLSDATPDETDDGLQDVETPAARAADEEEEAECPEPFDWTHLTKTRMHNFTRPDAYRVGHSAKAAKTALGC